MIQFLFGLLGMKNSMLRKILENKYAKHAAKIPESLQKNCVVLCCEINERAVWTISSNKSTTENVILYLHGGAYFASLTTMHWQWIEQLALATKFEVVVPDYPLAPENSCETCYDFVERVYADIQHKYAGKQVVFMGDSAGATLTLGFAQYLASSQQTVPHKIVLFSPWLDATLSNPLLSELDKLDKILNIDALKHAAYKFAGKADTSDYRLSPLNGSFTELGEITIFVGTHEIFLADCRLLHHKLTKLGIKFNYFEYANMFHDWIIVKQLPQTKQVLNWIESYFK